MNNLKVSARLMMLIGILSALLIAIGAVGVYGMGQSNDALKTVDGGEGRRMLGDGSCGVL